MNTRKFQVNICSFWQMTSLIKDLCTVNLWENVSVMQYHVEQVLMQLGVKCLLKICVFVQYKQLWQWKLISANKNWLKTTRCSIKGSFCDTQLYPPLIIFQRNWDFFVPSRNFYRYTIFMWKISCICLFFFFFFVSFFGKIIFKFVKTIYQH